MGWHLTAECCSSLEFEIQCQMCHRILLTACFMVGNKHPNTIHPPWRTQQLEPLDWTIVYTAIMSTICDPFSQRSVISCRIWQWRPDSSSFLQTPNPVMNFLGLTGDICGLSLLPAYPLQQRASFITSQCSSIHLYWDASLAQHTSLVCIIICCHSKSITVQ